MVFQIDELRDRYMAKAVAFVKSTEEALAPAREEVKQLQREVNADHIFDGSPC